ARRSCPRLSKAAAMDSCASLSNSPRSSGEYSADCDTELDGVEGIACGFCGWDIALPAAEHKRTAAALHCVAVNLRPETNEIIGGGYKRETDHQPDGSK